VTRLGRRAGGDEGKEKPRSQLERRFVKEKEKGSRFMLFEYGRYDNTVPSPFTATCRNHPKAPGEGLWAKMNSAAERPKMRSVRIG
jgi:hypothetical protein